MMSWLNPDNEIGVAKVGAVARRAMPPSIRAARCIIDPDTLDWGIFKPFMAELSVNTAFQQISRRFASMSNINAMTAVLGSLHLRSVNIPTNPTTVSYRAVTQV
jgi:hypothetical protein